MNNPSFFKKKAGLISIIVIILILIVGVSFYHSNQASASHAGNHSNPQNPINGSLLPAPVTISEFHLIDNTGKPFTNSSLYGHWTFMLFGYTRCHDVCPDSLSQINKMFLQWQGQGKAAPLPQTAFVTVDPNRDTPHVLNDYVKSFNPAFIGLRGNQATLNQFKNELKIYFAKVPKKDQDYGMEHSSQLYIFNPDGKWVGILTYPFQSDRLATDYNYLLENYNKSK